MATEHSFFKVSYSLLQFELGFTFIIKLGKCTYVTSFFFFLLGTPYWLKSCLHCTLYVFSYKIWINFIVFFQASELATARVWLGWICIKVSLGRVISRQQKHLKVWVVQFCTGRKLQAKMVECLQVIVIYWHKSDLMASTVMLNNTLLVPYWYLSASWTKYLSAHSLSISHTHAFGHLRLQVWKLKNV